MLPADSVSTLPGVGPKRLRALSTLGVATIGDLLRHMPLRYEDRRNILPIAKLTSGEPASTCGEIVSVDIRRAQNKNLHIATVTVADDTAAVTAVFFGGYRSFSSLKEGAQIFIYGTPEIGRTGALEFQSPDWTLLREEGEVPHEWARLLPIYPTTGEISRGWLGKLIYRCVASPKLSAPDPLPREILNLRDLPAYMDALRGIHVPSNMEEARRARRRMAYQELFEQQCAIADMARQQTAHGAPSLKGGASMRERAVSALPFALTDAQISAGDEIAADLGETRPMRRLLQGDVGCGKTVVALLAVAQCVGAGCQAAILAPTTILSAQFFHETERLLAPLGLRAAELRSGMTKRARAALLGELAEGGIDILVGTHAMLEDDVAFKSLGLIVIDEQHRFGVIQRERLAGKSRGAHILMMSATPIPRTLCMALYGDVDVSQVRGKPASRKPVTTKLVSSNHMRDLYRFLADRLSRGERGEKCFWVCPQIGEEGCEDATDDTASVMARAQEIERAMQGVLSSPVLRMHGRMTADEKFDVMARFAHDEARLIVSTTVIEVGVDVPDASIIVIEGAAGFGLSQLHQLRGRVGRGERPGICILLDDARRLSGNERLRILSTCDDGFQIAEADLRLRGAGEIAGTRQHGEINFKFARIPEDEPLLAMAREDAKKYSMKNI